MKEISTDTLHQMLAAPFAKSLALMMNSSEKKLLSMAIYNLQMASGIPDSDTFVTQMLLPYLENNVARELPVHSSGGRAATADVLNDLLCRYEEDLGISLNTDEVASAMKYVMLFLCAVCYIREPSLAVDLGITKAGFFKPRCVYTTS